MKLYEDLVYRGLIKDVAGENIKEILNGKPITFYWGTDPTGDSLHIGHYSSLVTVKRLMNAGHKAIILCGGATGRIGDPKPSAEREILDYKVVDNNVKLIKNQLNDLFKGKAEIVDNYEWLKDFKILNFLREVGKYINVNYMLNKDIISRRLETGITFAEFTYTLLQGYDFLYLYQNKNCIMQVEGSDQWGNITTGVDLIRKKLGKEVYAFTMPLILDATGKKFGKSEGNALWLSKEKTSPYQLYQYLINSADSKVFEYLKIFTFLEKDEIEDIMIKHNKQPELRLAQKTLAYEIVKDIHGEDEANKARKKSEEIFGSKGASSETETINVSKNLLNKNVIDILMLSKIFESKSEIRRLIQQNGISLNNKKVTDINMIIKQDLLIDNSLLIQKGKKKFIKLLFK